MIACNFLIEFYRLHIKKHCEDFHLTSLENIKKIKISENLVNIVFILMQIINKMNYYN